MSYRTINVEDWPHAELRGEDVLVREIFGDEIKPGAFILTADKLSTRMFLIEKLGSQATEIDPRLEVGKVCLPIVELVRYFSNSGYFVISARDMAVTFPAGHLTAPGQEKQ